MRRVGKLPAVLFVLWTGTILWMVGERTQVIQRTVSDEHSAAAVCPCALYASYSPEKRRDGEEELHGGPSTQSPVELRRNDSKRAVSVRNETQPVLENDRSSTRKDTSGGSSISLNDTSKFKEETAEAEQGNVTKLEAVQQRLKELEEKILKEEAQLREKKEKTDKLVLLQKELEERLSLQLKEQNVKEKFTEEEKMRQEKIAQQQLDQLRKQKVETKKETEKVHPASTSQNPGMFNFTISNGKACKEGANTDGHVDALCLVFTAPGDSVMRSRIRETWGGVKDVKGKKFVTMFLLGQKGSTFQESIVKENNEHHDIIQQDFTDSYYNLTLKTLMGLRWASEFCPNARFVVKMDIDMFVNLYNLADRVDSAPVHNLAEGNLKGITEPIRNNKSKWYTSRDMYPKDKYPPYLNGPAYLISGDLAGPIYKESFNVRFLPWEDAFIGIIMNRLHVEPKFNSKYESYLKYENEADTLLKIGKSITFHLGEDKEENKENIVKVWRYVQNLNNVTVV